MCKKTCSENTQAANRLLVTEWPICMHQEHHSPLPLICFHDLAASSRKPDLVYVVLARLHVLVQSHSLIETSMIEAQRPVCRQTLQQHRPCMTHTMSHYVSLSLSLSL